jgi:deazaflavin-dependent oxidoreductase (nitroreductase family)
VTAAIDWRRKEGTHTMAVQLTRSGTRGTGFGNMPRWALKLFQAMNLGMFRVGGGWMRIQGRPLLLLTTRGAKTGLERKTTLGYFEDLRDGAEGEAWLVVASAAGAAKHPAWYVNLAKKPEQVWAELGPERGRVRRVRAESLRGAERERAWAEIVRQAPAYGKYAEQTDRQIPIVRLAAI